jgi:thioredoxin-related protein
MISRAFTLISFLFICKCGLAQAEHGLVNWLTFKEAQEKNKVTPKPFLIDLYTDWCGWCKHMVKTTYSNPGLANYINTYFYPVQFNAETKDTIEYNGKVYKPLSPAPRTAHELTVKFLGNNLSYPSTMFVTNNFEYNLLVPGFIEDKKFEPMLLFIVENAWQTATYDEFNKHFLNTFYDTVFPKIPVKTYSIPEVEKLQKKQPRKVLVNISSDFCNTGKVMSKTSYVDTSIAKYINKNFYLVNLNAASTDTIIFKNEKFYNVPINNFALHSLGFKLSNNRLTLPSLCILDEQLNTIDALNYYQSPERLKPILHFIGSNAYKTKNFNDFMQEYMKTQSQKTSNKK